MTTDPLHHNGRWLDAHFDAIGETSTLDMIKTYE